MFSAFCRLVALAIAVPFAALADLNLTVMLPANTALNLETGATSASGGDILWNGSTITPQGSATAVVVGNAPFNVLTLGVLTSLPGYSASPISARDLAVNNVFAVHTNLNRYAKLLVRANAGGSITLQLTTYGAPAASTGGPTVTAIENNSSRIPAGFPNHGIAPSSLFVVVGSGLSDPGQPVLQSSEPPGIPQTLNGTSISVTVNGVTTRPGLWYASPGQLAAVLPASTPVGAGTLTITYRGATSAPAPIQVVPSAVGINSYSGNQGVATDAMTGSLLTFANSGSPGQNIVLWTTGLGANPADSDTVFAPTPHAVNTPLQIYIGGVLATILYQGSSGYPGVNQINVTIPESVPAGCFVPVAAVAGSILSNVVTIPIQAGGGACADSVTGLNGQQVATANVRTGLVSLVQTTQPGNAGGAVLTNSANAAFGRYAGLADAATGVLPSPGGCVAAPVIAGGRVTFTGLDAGVITLTGPNGLTATLSSQLGLRGAYNVLLASGAIPQSGGTFTFRGAGGTDVGSFTSVIQLTNPLLTWTNQSAAAAIDRTQGLPVTWNGGNPSTFVAITGTSGAGNPGAAVVGFTCVLPVEAGRFTVPPYILLAMPAGRGGVVVKNIIYAPLSASGLDVGLALGDISYTVASTFR